MKKLIALLLMFTASDVMANYHFCRGTLSHVWVDGGGSLIVLGSWRGDHTMICNVSSEWRGIAPDTCKAWLSLVQVAKVSSAPVLVRYSSADAQSCSALPTYGNAPRPNYVMLEN